MFNKIRDNSIRSLLLFALFTCMLTAPAVLAQEQGAQSQDVKTEIVQAKAVSSNQAPASVSLQPRWADYKGVRIGTGMDEVRDVLDGLKEKGKVQDLFVISDSETGQVFYDEEGKVKAIAVNYFDSQKAPNVLAVFGEEVQAKADGSLYKLVRYPDAGYWVAYSRTAGDAPLVTVTIQKM